MNRHQRRAAAAMGDTSIKIDPRTALAKRIALMNQHSDALSKAWSERHTSGIADPVLIIVDTDDVIGRNFTPQDKEPGGIVIGLTSASELGAKLHDVEPDVYSFIQRADTSRPLVVCIAYCGTTAGYGDQNSDSSKRAQGPKLN